MSKVKNRERKQQKTPTTTADRPGRHAQDPALENTEPMLMPSVSQPVAHKKAKRYGHN